VRVIGEALAMRLPGIICLLAACASDEGATSTDQPSAACRAVADNVFRTKFVVTDVAAFDGKSLGAVTSIRTLDGTTCRAGDRVTIASGSAEARVENRRDDAVYPLLGAWIDVDGDGACVAEVDLVWTIIGIAGAPGTEDTVTLTAELFALHSDEEGCARLRE
jgi:hypothetical protein